MGLLRNKPDDPNLNVAPIRHEATDPTKDRQSPPKSDTTQRTRTQVKSHDVAPRHEHGAVLEFQSCKATAERDRSNVTAEPWMVPGVRDRVGNPLPPLPTRAAPRASGRSPSAGTSVGTGDSAGRRPSGSRYRGTPSPNGGLRSRGHASLRSSSCRA